MTKLFQIFKSTFYVLFLKFLLEFTSGFKYIGNYVIYIPFKSFNFTKSYSTQIISLVLIEELCRSRKYKIFIDLCSGVGGIEYYAKPHRLIKSNILLELDYNTCKYLRINLILNKMYHNYDIVCSSCTKLPFKNISTIIVMNPPYLACSEKLSKSLCSGIHGNLIMQCISEVYRTFRNFKLITSLSSLSPVECKKLLSKFCKVKRSIKVLDVIEIYVCLK